MRFVTGVLLLALGGAAAFASDRLLLRPTAGGETPPLPETEANAGDTPLVWVGGTLETVEEDRLTVRDGEEPAIDLQRFAGGSTRFYRATSGEWQQLDPEEVSGLEGEDACIEALLATDPPGGQTEAFLAVRVFLGADCGPS